MEAVTIRRLEENREEQESPEEPQEHPKEQESPQEQKQEPTEQENQENEGPQKINPMEFLMQEDEGSQENYELEFLGAEEPTTLEIDTMDILEQLEERTGPPTVHVRKTNVSTELAAKENLAKQEKPLKEQVPQELHNYLSVFDKKTAERFSKSRPWDHAIDFKPDFIFGTQGFISNSRTKQLHYQQCITGTQGRTSPSHIHPGRLDSGGWPHILQRMMLRTRQLRS